MEVAPVFDVIIFIALGLVFFVISALFRKKDYSADRTSSWIKLRRCSAFEYSRRCQQGITETWY